MDVHIKNILLFLFALSITNCSKSSDSSQTLFLSIEAPSHAIIGQDFSFNLKALDSSKNIKQDYSSTIRISSTDPNSKAQEVTIDKGSGTSTYQFTSIGKMALIATDTSNTNISTISNVINVTGSSSPYFLITAPNTTNNGTSISFTIKALDASNKLFSKYSGTIHFTSTDYSAQLPNDTTLKDGIGTFSTTLKNIGSQTITATDKADPTFFGVSNKITVTAVNSVANIDPTTHFSITTQDFASSNSSFSVTINALSDSNAVINNYSGKIHFSSTDNQAQLPSDSILTNGTGTFLITLQTIGKQTITVSDTVNTSLTGTTKEIAVSGASPESQMDVLTYHNDSAHTGQYLYETTLTHDSVNSTSFGKLFAQAVDGQIFAQPLYKNQVTIPGLGVHNVIYVATMHDSVYAFDADSNTGANARPLWQRTFLDPANGITSVPISDYPNYTDIQKEIGVLSTPVIDASSGTIFCVAKTKELTAVTASNPYGHVYRLHALDLASGQEKFGGPVILGGRVNGTGDANVNGVISFDPYIQNQRGALLLANGVLYFTYSSYGGVGQYHGWVMAYSAKDLSQVAIWNDTPNNPSMFGANAGRGGIWMNGSSPAWDGSSIYLSTGNGYFDSTAPVTNFGDSVMKLDASLSVVDYFSPSNQGYLNAHDLDLGAGGILLLPTQPGTAPKLMLATGKDGTAYLINRDDMGQYQVTDQIIQEYPSLFPGTTSLPAYWNNTIYFKGSTPRLSTISPTPLYAFPLIPGTNTSPTTIDFANPSSQSINTWGWPGSTPSISANGINDGIVWVIEINYTFVNHVQVPSVAILRAYDASNLATELFNSTLNTNDGLGNAIKFSLPVIANGKVYVGTDALNPTTNFPSEISVFGLK